MWVSFKQKMPEEGQKIIVRSPGVKRDEDFIEDYRYWKKEILDYKPKCTHWWNDHFNFDKALAEWSKPKI